MKKFIPVIDKNQKPLMPTSPKKARKWIESRKATPFWKKGVFCVRLNVEPSDRNLQPVCVGIDPGSRKEGYTIKSQQKTFLNIQTDAVTWVKKHIETRATLRKSRRSRKTPCRKPRFNRNHKKSFLAPSIKSRWQWKLRIINWLSKMFPISDIAVEDICAMSKKGQKKWNVSFSPLMTGKKWFYDQVRKNTALHLYEGWQTKGLRDLYGLKKNKAKMSNTFDAHCVDSWVIADNALGGSGVVDEQRLIQVIPLRFHRRQLHMMVPVEGGERKRYGGTMSLGLKRGSLVRHPKYDLAYVGGYQKGRIALHDLKTAKRFCQNAKVEDCKFLCYNSWRCL